MSRVSLINVTKRYGKVEAVSKVSLDIEDGEFFVLLGPSGSGKTTTLRLIAGLEVPEEGEVRIDGEVVNHKTPKERNIAMVFQNYALYPHMSVYDNIAFPLIVRRKELRLSKSEIDRKVREVAELLKISELLSRKPAQLSGGQQQRVALARALVREPNVWLLDEPLSNIDAKLRTEMRAEIKRLQLRLKVTTIYVTHDQVEAMTLADRIAVMNYGKVFQVGKPLELYNNPKNMFVASFIGSPGMNFMRARVESSDPKVRVGSYVLNLSGLPEVSGLREYVGKEVVFGVRPEDVLLVDDGSYDADAEVVVSEPLGSETIVTLKLSDNVVKSRTHGSKLYSIGSKVRVRFVKERIKFFDPNTGELISS